MTSVSLFEITDGMSTADLVLINRKGIYTGIMFNLEKHLTNIYNFSTKIYDFLLDNYNKKNALIERYENQYSQYDNKRLIIIYRDNFSSVAQKIAAGKILKQRQEDND